MAPQQSPAKDSSILIVGAGVFGLSTALYLAQDGYTNIIVLDRAPVPSPYSAGNDLNKIVRAEYEDPFYTDLALDAIKQWQTPFWAPYYRATGYFLATSPNAPQKSRDSLQKSFSSIQHHPAFPPGSFSAIKSAEQTRKSFPMLKGNMDGWEGYLNRYAGYATAAKALEHAAKTCVELGVKFVTGDSGYAIEILYEAGSKRCVGVKTANGTVHKASRMVLCLGAYISTLLPAMAPQITAKSWSVAHIQLTPAEAASMKGCPVVNCRDMGFFFEPDEDTGLLKFSANGSGYTNYVSSSKSSEQMSVPPASNDGIPKEDEKVIKRLIAETIPQLSGRQLVKKFICWCGDTAESEYVIDFVPGSEGLMVVAGDSGHAFKMLPVAGQWVKTALLDGEQKMPRWRWKDGKSDSDDISWRVGKVRDIKDVEIVGLKSRI